MYIVTTEPEAWQRKRSILFAEIRQKNNGPMTMDKW